MDLITDGYSRQPRDIAHTGVTHEIANPPMQVEPKLLHDCFVVGPKTVLMAAKLHEPQQYIA